MGLSVTLDYRGQPWSLPLAEGSKIVTVPALPAPSATAAELIELALAQPHGCGPLESLMADIRALVMIVSDPTRHEPRQAMVEAVIARVPERVDITLAIATGTHGPCDPDELQLSPAVWRRVNQIVNHDGHDQSNLRTLGTTRHGTPVTLHRCLVEADLIVATGAIIPHYFAGFGGGLKSVFPGLGEARAIRHNHRLKTEPSAVAGRTHGNVCRDDLGEAVAMLPTPVVLLNMVMDHEGRPQSAVAGDLHAAFEFGASACRGMYRVVAPTSSLIVVGGRSPETDSLYQASKLIAAVAPCLEPGGTIILVAGCERGVGGVDVVNEAIYRIGLAPRLPKDHTIVLFSELPDSEVAKTYCRPTADLSAELAGRPALVFPVAKGLLTELN